ncbi:MAG TPA: ATP-binding protein [Steroidobacteraceae bacterium]|nr:ATP-binding protein [Steroidobacteraceae bacterium]
MPDNNTENAQADINRTVGNQQQIAQLMAVASNSLDLQSYIDRNYVYHYVNQTWLDYWQMQRARVEGSTAMDVWGDDVFNEIVKPRIDTALSGELIEYQSTLNFPLRGKRHVDMAYIPARDATGEVVGVVVRVHDIDNLKKMGEALQAMVKQLEEKNQSQERLIHTLSHDLREPVNTLVNFSSLLLDEFGMTLPVEARRYAGFIHSGSERLRVLLNDLLSLVRLDQQCVELGDCDLNAIFDGVVNDLGSAIEHAHAQITRNELPVITAQCSLLQLLFQNLLANAIKFVARDVTPEVHLDVRAVEDGWQFRLTDNGIGIAEQYREKVFDLFARLHSRNEYDGTGFGLAACRRIVELHGGRIWIETPANGKGSCFCFTLPTSLPGAMS